MPFSRKKHSPPSGSREQFLFEVLSRVRFTYDRKAIRRELEDHLEDHIEACQEEGLSAEDAEHRAVAAMGDADTLGAELNREHSPVIGWIWNLSRLIFIVAILASLVLVALPMYYTLKDTLFPTPEERPKKADIVYQVDVGYEGEFEDYTIRISEVIYTRDQTLTIYYQMFSKPFGLDDSAHFWFAMLPGDFFDEKGMEHYGGGGNKKSGLFAKKARTLEHFPADAKKLIIDYDKYNRKFHVEIPLPGNASQAAVQSFDQREQVNSQLSTGEGTRKGNLP